MVRVLHVICDCNGGGAERIVLELAARGGHAVAPVYAGGELEAEKVELFSMAERQRTWGPSAQLTTNEVADMSPQWLLLPNGDGLGKHHQ